MCKRGGKNVVQYYWRAHNCMWASHAPPPKRRAAIAGMATKERMTQMKARSKRSGSDYPIGNGAAVVGEVD